MSESATEKPTKDGGANKVADDDVEAEEDVILGDGFAVVDDDKADDNKNGEEESPKEDSTAETKPAAEGGKASGEGKTEKTPKEADKAKPAAAPPAENGVQQDETTKSSPATKKADVKPSQAKADSKPSPAKADSSKSPAVAAAAAATAKKPSGESKGEKPAAVAAAASTASKEADKSISSSEAKDDSLVITAEDDIDVAETDESKKTRAKSPVVNGKPARTGKAGGGSPSMWVSNIARRIKATDLKRVFSKHGKVVTAKIVTNGKNYFGYVSMDSAKSIERCIKYLNHTRLGDKKITISSERPDAPKKKAVATKTVVKRASPPKKKDIKTEKEADAKPKPGGVGEKKVVADDKKDNEKVKVKVEKDKEKDPLTLVSSTSPDAKGGPEAEDKERPARKRIEAPKRDETLMLKRELRRTRGEVERLKRRQVDEQAHNKTLQMRAKRFERAYKEMDEKLRQERKMWERERESLQKKNRLEQIKMDAERDILEKERMEVRRRREDLERELRKLGELQRAVVAERSSHRRKSRSVTPPRMAVSGGKRLKGGELKHEPAKKARWSGDRTRTPPPPPKLTPSGEGGRGKRDHDHHFYEERGGRRDSAVYVPPGGYHHEGGREGRHRGGGGFAPEAKAAVAAPARGGWGGAGPEGWRGPPGDVPSGYGGERFRGEPYRGPSGGYSGQGGGGRDDVHGYSSHSRVSDHSRSEPEYRRPVHYEGAPRKY